MDFLGEGKLVSAYFKGHTEGVLHAVLVYGKSPDDQILGVYEPLLNTTAPCLKGLTTAEFQNRWLASEGIEIVSLPT